MKRSDRSDQIGGLTRKQLLAAGAGAAGIAAGAGLIGRNGVSVASAAAIPASARRDGAPTVLHMTMAVVGAKQGAFRGNAPGGRASLIWAYTSELDAVLDTTTGYPTGKRQWNPIVVTKPIDASTPMLLQSAATNEALSSVKFTFFQPSPKGTGAMIQYLTVELTNASVVESRQYTTDTEAQHFGAFGMHLIEDIAFVFAKIDVKFLNPSVEFVDDWSPPGA